MNRLGIGLAARLVAVALISVSVAASAAETEGNKPPRSTLFVGVDTSGSFRFAYDDALTFVAHYLYGHMHEYGGLSKPRDLFVTSIGGKSTRSTTSTTRTSGRSRRTFGSGSRPPTRSLISTSSSSRSRAT
jgi:hypothetical protein